MRFEAIDLDGAWLIHPERIEDSRGYFVRTFCINEFGEHGLATEFPQHSVSVLVQKGDSSRHAFPARILTAK